MEDRDTIEDQEILQIAKDKALLETVEDPKPVPPPNIDKDKVIINETVTLNIYRGFRA